MNLILKTLSAVSMAFVAYPAFANPLDLSNQVQSVVCTGNAAKLEYQAATKTVVVTTGQNTKTYKLTSLKKAVSGLQLVAQSPTDGLHVSALVRPDGGRSLVQFDGTYFYARCEVK